MLPLLVGRMAPHRDEVFAMRRCVTGLTDTCRKSRAAISKRGHSNLSPVRHRSLLAARGARPGDRLLGQHIRILCSRLVGSPLRNHFVSLGQFAPGNKDNSGSSVICSPRSTNFTKKRLDAGGVTSLRNPWRSAAGRVVGFRGRGSPGGPMRSFKADGSVRRPAPPTPLAIQCSTDAIQGSRLAAPIFR
jgi:hypothetical protein